MDQGDWEHTMLYIFLASIFGLVALYLNHVNNAMKRVPPDAQQLSPHRWTVEEVKAAYKKSLEDPIDMNKSVPPKQSRRYVVVGGSGLVGGWVVSHLLARGEEPASLRILDLTSPTQDILDRGVDFIKTDITDAAAVSAAFEKPWPTSVAHLPLTVFHTAAIIRPQDRLEMFLPLCSKVNVDGTRNIVNAARTAGARCFISTSSGSITLHKPTFWIAPWTKYPKNIVQIISDEAVIPSRHDQFFGNYAVSKAEAERIVRAADDPASNFRTGCIRPANGIYGIGSDVSASITGVYLRKGGSPTWVTPILQSFVNAENVSIAHLLYEESLCRQSQPGSSLPDTGGQAYVVTDPNPAIAFKDIYTLLNALSSTPLSFPVLQPGLLLVFSYLVEAYVVIQEKLLFWLLPKITGDLVQMQPSLFAISDVFCFADDRRAKKRVENGGLGYNPPLTTLDGMCKQLVEWNSRAERQEGREKKGIVDVTKGGIDVGIVVPERKI